MKERGFLLTGLSFLAVCLLAVSGCMPPMGPVSDSESDGAVMLRFSDGRAQAIAPSAENLAIAIYEISFTRSGQSPVTLSVPSSATQTPPIYLKPGNWDVAVSAMNSKSPPDTIGVATSTVTVNAGKISTATSLTPAMPGKNPIPLNFTMGEGSATYSDSVLAGSYLLQLVLKDGTETLANYADTVLVTAGLTTTGNLRIKAKTGPVAIHLVNEMIRPIAITLSGAQATLIAGSSMTVTATPSVTVDSYQWYLDGVEISDATTNQVTVGSGLDAGEYTLTVVAKKDTLYSSQGVDFTVTLKAALTAVYAGGAGGYWMNDIWIGLTNPYGDSAWVHSLVESGFDVYAGGSCSTNPNGTGLLRAGY